MSVSKEQHNKKNFHLEKKLLFETESIDELFQ